MNAQHRTSTIERRMKKQRSSKERKVDTLL